MGSTPLDLSLWFLPEALAGLATVRGLDDEADRRWMNQIRAASYLHIFDLLETCVAEAARAQAMRDVDTRDALAPLLRLDAFDHSELFHGFERTFEESFPVAPSLIPRPDDLDAVLSDAAPLSLLILALHLKLVTQQHYLACVRGDESLEPSFVRVLKEHWTMECGRAHSSAPPGPASSPSSSSSSSLSLSSSSRPPAVNAGGPDSVRELGSERPSSTLRAAAGGNGGAVAIQQALAAALPGRVPAALRDYRRIVFACDDVLRRQSDLDVATLEAVRKEPFAASDREAIVEAQIAAHQKTFLTFGIVNAAFVYAMKSLGPSAPAMLAGVVSALSAR